MITDNRFAIGRGLYKPEESPIVDSLDQQSGSDGYGISWILRAIAAGVVAFVAA